MILRSFQEYKAAIRWALRNSNTPMNYREIFRKTAEYLNLKQTELLVKRSNSSGQQRSQHGSTLSNLLYMMRKNSEVEPFVEKNSVSYSLKKRENNPTHEEIARRAYEIYISRGCVDGQSDQDWFFAEMELRREQ